MINRITACGLVIAALFTCGTAQAAENTLGKNEFDARCAMCHGAGGKGDGWLADNLLKRPPSLTLLKKNNGGVFPMATVTEVIDGRKAVSLHGPRDMPVWGTVFSSMSRDNGAGLQMRLANLTGYIKSLQSK